MHLFINVYVFFLYITFFNVVPRIVFVLNSHENVTLQKTKQKNIEVFIK